MGAAAKLCNYRSDEEGEVIMRAVTKGAVEARDRTLAHRNWFSQRSLKDLIDSLQDWEVEQLNENDFQRSHGQQVAALAKVPRVSNDRFGQQSEPGRINAIGWNTGERRTGGSWYNGQRRSSFRGGSQGRVRFHSSNSNNPGNSRCWRCGSIFHTEADCRAKHKVCNQCGKLGHIARVCRDPKSGFDKQTRAQKRNWRNTVNEATGTAAKVQKLDEVRELEQQVFSKPSDSVDAQVGQISYQKNDKYSGSHFARSYDRSENDAIISAKVAGTEVSFFIDSGARVNTITRHSFDKILESEIFFRQALKSICLKCRHSSDSSIFG